MFIIQIWNFIQLIMKVYNFHYQFTYYICKFGTQNQILIYIKSAKKIYRNKENTRLKPRDPNLQLIREESCDLKELMEHYWC